MMIGNTRNTNGKNAIRGPFIALTIRMAFCGGAILYSHYAQVRDKEEMRDGVRRDKERLRIKRQKRQEKL